MSLWHSFSLKKNTTYCRPIYCIYLQTCAVCIITAGIISVVHVSCALSSFNMFSELSWPLVWGCIMTTLSKLELQSFFPWMHCSKKVTHSENMHITISIVLSMLKIKLFCTELLLLSKLSLYATINCLFCEMSERPIPGPILTSSKYIFSPNNNLKPKYA